MRKYIEWKDRIFLGKAYDRKAQRLLRKSGIAGWCSVFGVKHDRSKLFAEEGTHKVHLISLSNRKVLEKDIWGDLENWLVKERQDSRSLEESLAIVLQQELIIKELSKRVQP